MRLTATLVSGVALVAALVGDVALPVAASDALADKAAAAAGLVANPFPSLRKVGDTLFTTLHPLLVANKTDKVDAVKGALDTARARARVCAWVCACAASSRPWGPFQPCALTAP